MQSRWSLHSWRRGINETSVTRKNLPFCMHTAVDHIGQRHGAIAPGLGITTPDWQRLGAATTALAPQCKVSRLAFLF